MSITSHVFIVGLPRTGSTLTRAIINASGRARLGGESHFLDEPTHLGLRRRPGYAKRFRRIGDIATDEGVKRLVDHIFSLRGKSYWSRLALWTDRDILMREILASDRSDAALLDIAMSHFADGRPIRGEKTPHHVYHVPTLLTWYPSARVIHTIRDPRAVYVSLRHKERAEKLTRLGRLARHAGPAFERYAVASLVRRWRAVADLHRLYAARYPDRYLLVRFEDLVAQPEPSARRLSEFLGFEYTQAMLRQVVHNSSFGAEAVASGIDASALDRWRRYLSQHDGERLTAALANDLPDFGYSA
jgi:hypothetical protein